MNILEFEECALRHDGEYGYPSYEFHPNDLKAYKAAVIEEYKASLVLVGYERKGMLFFEDDISDENLYTKLYALSMSSQNELPKETK